jgi:hypothetical protein
MERIEKEVFMTRPEFYVEKLNEKFQDLIVEFVDFAGDVINLKLHACIYDRTGNVAITSYHEGQPYARLTVNVGKVADDELVADTNNFPLSGVILSEYGIAKITGKVAESGFCSYPVYRLIGV